jgi:hypothetical protein
MTVIRRHKLQPVNDEFQITDEMFAEAAAIDERHGGTGVPPELIEDLYATIEGRPNSGVWKPVDPDDFSETKMRAVSTEDAAYSDFLVKLRKLLTEEQPPHELALRIATHMAVGLAVVELGWDAQKAKAWFSKATEEFSEKLKANASKPN